MSLESTKYPKTLFCQRCPSKILVGGTGHLHVEEVSLPLPDISKNSETVATETLSEFVAVQNIYDFDNVGFSNTVDNKKYLTCADCEVGPIGWHCLHTKVSYVALSRVKQ